MSEDFKKAHDARNDEVTEAPKAEIVTKKEVEALEKQRKKAAPQLNLTPPGMKQKSLREEEKKALLERMKQKLKRKGEKVREDFSRSADM